MKENKKQDYILLLLYQILAATAYIGLSSMKGFILIRDFSAKYVFSGSCSEAGLAATVKISCQFSWG